MGAAKTPEREVLRRARICMSALLRRFPQLTSVYVLGSNRLKTSGAMASEITLSNSDAEGTSVIYAIELNLPLLSKNISWIGEIVRHELAHLVVGCKRNHDDVWRAAFIELGGSGERCHRMRAGE